MCELITTCQSSGTLRKEVEGARWKGQEELRGSRRMKQEKAGAGRKRKRRQYEESGECKDIMVPSVQGSKYSRFGWARLVRLSVCEFLTMDFEDRLPEYLPKCISLFLLTLIDEFITDIERFKIKFKTITIIYYFFFLVFLQYW